MSDRHPIKIILPLDGGPEQALRCVSALAELPEEPAHEVVIVDDAAVGLGDLFARLSGDVRIVSTGARSGLAAASRLGAEAAAGDVVIFLRDAPEVERDWLRNLMTALERPGVAVAASVERRGSTAHPTASPAIAVRRRDLERVGGFPDAPSGLAFAAVCMNLAAQGTVESVQSSVAVPAGRRMVAARRRPGEAVELTVVIPTLDATSERVRRCVGAIQANTDCAHDVVIVDNGAPPQGFTAPVNAGLRAVGGPYAVVMNDDVEVMPGWWRPLRQAIDDGASVAFPHTVAGPMRTDFAAWCFAVGRDTLEQFACAPGEFFDPALVVWFQDTDLYLRLRAAGRPPVYVNEAQITHGLSESVRTDDAALRGWIDQRIAADKRAFETKHPEVDAKPRATA